MKVGGSEDPDQIVINIFNEKLGVNVTKSDLDIISHRLQTATG